MYTALRLAEIGIGVQLIDKESRTAGHSYACALHPRTLQLLDEVGVAREAIKLGNRIDKIVFYEGALRRAGLDLSRLPVKFPFVLVLEQRVLEDLLWRKIEAQAGLEVRWNHRLADLAIQTGAATIDELAMEGKGYGVPDCQMAVKKSVQAPADYVVGADGQGSIVRQRLDIDYERFGQPELFVVYEFETEGKLAPEISIVLDPHAAGVLWPFSQNKGRWSFQWLQPDASSDFPQKDRSPFAILEPLGPDDSRHRLLRLLGERAPWFQGGIKNVGWATDIQFEHRLARQFGRDRAWLAGDAAHQTGPVGMQSMNMGIREGADLAAKLTRILREKGSPDLLDAYGLEHRAEWEQLLGRKGDPKAGAATDQWVREHCGRLPACIPASGNELTLLLRQLGLEFEFASLQEVRA
jgi:2-polyprenyl-6-methoxyphenol hydroxylase-like FAD-dependent oxidoreductase